MQKNHLLCSADWQVYLARQHLPRQVRQGAPPCQQQQQLLLLQHHREHTPLQRILLQHEEPHLVCILIAKEGELWMVVGAVIV